MSGGNLGNAVQTKVRGDILSFPLYRNTEVWRGTPVAIETVHGYAIEAADTTNTQKFVGMAEEYVDTRLTPTTDGAKSVKLRRHGIFRMTKNTASAFTDVGKLFFLHTVHTASVTFKVGLAAACTYDVAIGLCVRREPDTPGGDTYTKNYLMIDITPTPWASLDLATYAALLASTSNGEGASLVGVEDANSRLTAADVEAALQEIALHSIMSIQKFIPISLYQWREIGTGVVGNIAAIGGVLASDTTPSLTAINGVTNACQVIHWATSGVDPIAITVPLPPDMDLTKDLVLHLRIVSGGTTNAVGFTVDSWFNEADTKVVDSSGTNQTASYAEVIATIAAADIEVGAQTVTISLTPVAHTTDTMRLSATWLEYAGKLLVA